MDPCDSLLLNVADDLDPCRKKYTGA